MSQFEWDYLEEHKQDIIDGKLVLASWDMEDVRNHCGVDKSLSDDQAIEVLDIFKWNLVFNDVIWYQMENAVNDVLEKAQEAKEPAPA